MQNDNIIDMPADDFEPEDNITLARITKDLKERVAKMSQDEIRFLVDTYYQYQKKRLRTQGQLRALAQGVDTAPENTPKSNDSVLSWLSDHEYNLEKQLEAALAFYAKRHPICSWAQKFKGVGPVISAGLVAHLRIEKAPTAGHFWNFAGLNPAGEWKKGEKRPWNADLKCLCFKLGESFVKAQGQVVGAKEGKNPFYAQQFTERKRFEVERNDAGYFRETAMATAKAGTLGKTTEAWKWVNGCYPAGMCSTMQSAAFKEQYNTETKRAAWIKLQQREPGEGQPMLPPAHIHAIARRWVVKLFLSHLHEFWFEHQYGEKPPAPYAIAIMGHAHRIQRPA